MSSEPDDPEVAARMRRAHTVACGFFGAARDARASDGGPQEVWGWRGRTLGRPVTGPYGPGWLRVAHSPADEASGKLWTGPEDAERLVPQQIPRPCLRLVRQWTEKEDAYRAELYDHVTGGPLSPTPVLAATPRLITAWWDDLRTALDRLSAVRTDRTAVRQAYLDRAMPKYLAFLGGSVPTTPPAWSTAHGDLHWANLAGPELGILDWEGWGTAPAGYDAALLYAYSLTMPETAERVRRELSTVLDSDAGRFAELVVITELLQSADRGDNLELLPALRQRAREVWHQMTADG
ncbi:phosphotransferase [Streptomyces sp. NBC_01142]|uniref:phosphotransferase n=1 Tax=Streptomyces sp. NBC_01142 TaxID=2975865 RepID=UPI002254C442|nr:phosphotransferase [Streptomyces sp. NBC_01142]MCX4820159.1 phosphotransferase [Streptomyces sp. NBC_01142]